MSEKCDRCGSDGDDRRTLWMACLYAMEETGVPFSQVNLKVASDPGVGPGRKFYTLRVCKDCRADWLAAVVRWFASPPRDRGCGSGIFVRENGVAREVTREEWDRTHPGQEPVAMRPQ